MQTFSLRTPRSRAEVTSHGAQLTAVEVDGRPLLFLSRLAEFAPGKAIRGGVPVCFPWFGGKQDAPAGPSHGFARISEWQVLETGEEFTVFRLEATEETRKIWPYEFRAEYRVELLPDGLRLTFDVENTSDAIFPVELALHTYLAVSDVRTVHVTGLNGKSYLDEADDLRRKDQAGDVTVAEEVDRRYLRSPGPVCLHDGERTVRITSLEGVRSTVVWNPWVEKARAMKDLGDEEWTDFLCIESGYVAKDRLELPPGERYPVSVEIKVV